MKRSKNSASAAGVVGTVLLLIFPAPSQAAEPAAGQALFEQDCAICHATESPERRIGPSLKGVKGGSLPSHKNATHDTVLHQIENGGGGMPVFRELLSKEQKEAIVAYVLTL